MKRATSSTMIGILSLSLSLSLSLAFVGLAACGSSKSGKSGGKQSKAKPAPIVEHDLSAAHAVWKGWTARAPKNAKVMADGVRGARLAADGKGMLDMKPGDDMGFDIVFEQSKTPLKGFKDVKDTLDRVVKASRGKMKYKILKESADAITWYQARGKHKVYHLVVHLKVGGQDASCRSNQMIGAGNEAELARFLTACRSLQKK